ncbi:hypothetical protein, partial [Mesorhizobium sp. M0571]|uniref:hypothetical protein n=1 Tax=Mesorhizobium sp. M0571 TaxID=2956960 RepID=UPI0033368C66
GSANGSAEWPTNLAEQVTEPPLWRELRCRIEGQEALPELTRHAADLLAEALVAKGSANGSAEWPTNLAEQVTEPPLWRELRCRIEGQELRCRIEGQEAS